MTPGNLSLIVGATFRIMGPRPRPLARVLADAAQFEDEPAVTLDELIAHIADAAAEDDIKLTVHRRLLEFDAQDSPGWGDGTLAQTLARRDVLYRELDLNIAAAGVLSRECPPHIVSDPGFQITDRFDAWFDQAQQETDGFYWPRYKTHLATVENWPDASVENLSRASKQVVERLGNPLAEEADARASRGLVVGYVQSGKTANFTGVIARAVDAGYRLIIVLTGMTTILRQQTQRRLDKQLIGKELLKGVAAAEFEYANADDWEEFIAHGARPRDLGVVDWIRLTTLASDYRRLRQGLAALHFNPLDDTQPINARVNLNATPIRLVVAMKNVSPLDALIADLKRVVAQKFDLSRLPALIIDDESDQASINTRRPGQAVRSKSDVRARTAINKRIVELLELLPRGQYVGYTATPYASVFVDPNDEVGIFPRDFIIALDRPDGYMGASEYHDFRPPPPGTMSNERRYVRDVRGEDRAEANLRKALDSFLLTGAIKLLRSEDPKIRINVRHHTMLAHTSHLTREHERLRDLLLELLDTGGYDTGDARSRLEAMLADDFAPVSTTIAAQLPFPASYAELEPYLIECYTRLQHGTTPVPIVNGERRFAEETPRFEEEPVWKVLVGGTKLSRGYTVEGLTVSYYRRTAKAADTLMQMGRWFGFRQGYADLMRLYIGRAEQLTKTRTIDLYTAFGAICEDEAEFRDELRQYVMPEDGSDPLRPLDVAPLVGQRLPDLKPTAANKMFNAVQRSANFGGKAIAPTLAPTSKAAIVGNMNAARELFDRVPLTSATLGDGRSDFSAVVGELTPPSMVEFLEAYRFSKAQVLAKQIAFLRGELGDPSIERWIAIWPMLSQPLNGTWPLAEGCEPTVIKRLRFESGRFNVYTGSDHVSVARIVNGLAEGSEATPDTIALRTPRTATALMYAVRDRDGQSGPVSIGFALYPPKNEITGGTKWGLVDPKRPDDAVIEITSSENPGGGIS